MESSGVQRRNRTRRRSVPLRRIKLNYCDDEEAIEIDNYVISEVIFWLGSSVVILFRPMLWPDEY